jgi:putative aminopeptidase FrvX
LARNVVAIIPGSDPAVRGEYVSITAHNDHIGFSHTVVDHDSLRAFNTVVRPLGADSPPRDATPEEVRRIGTILDSLRKIRPPRPDSISNGADDDGSGTIALIELAEAFMKGNVKPRRSILFVSHTAEEKGLRGSAWYTDHSTVPIDSIVAEIDVDMIGRGAATDIKAGGPTYLEVVGLRRLSAEFGDWFEEVNAKESLPFKFNYEYDAPGHPDQYYCRADHYSYARYGIPSVSLSRGSHMDYHQVTDEPQYIDYPDYARLTQLVFDGAVFVANADHRPRLDAPKPTDPHVRCKQ